MADTLIVRDTAGVGRRGAYDAPMTAGYVAGEALDAAAPCFVDSSGLVRMCNRTAHKETDSGATLYVGFTDRSVAVNQPVTLFGRGTEIHYAAATMTPGGYIFVADTDGRITQDEITVTVSVDGGGTTKVRVSNPVAFAKDASTIVLL